MKMRWLVGRNGTGMGMGGVVLGGLLLLAGCQSTSPTGARVTASITLTGRALSDIRMATLKVFQEAGYAVASAHNRDLIFEKRAPGMTDVAYGSWMDPAVWMRVKIRIEEMSPEVSVLDCSVYRVQNRGDTILEEESKAYGTKSGPFKELLAKVKARLDAGPTPTAK
jgi:hypothetical protein